MKRIAGLPVAMTALALLVGSSVQAATARPQLKDYATYNDFMRAVVDYTRQNEGSGADRECREDEVDAEGQPTDKENPCRPKLVRQDGVPLGAAPSSSGSRESSDSATDGSLPPDEADPSLDGQEVTGDDGLATDDSTGSTGDAMEQAIALARDGLNPVYSDPNNTRTTFRSFPMQPIESDDLAAVSLIDALTGLMVVTNDSRMRLNIDPSQLTNQQATEDSRMFSDDISLNLENFEIESLLISNIFGFETGNIVWPTDGTYYSVVTATPSLISDNGIGLGFSADARVRMAIVDSDGLASAGIPRAGAITIDPLRITTSTIMANLFAVDDGNGSTGVLATLDISDGIVVDLSNTQVGVAGATRNSSGGWNLSRISNFFYFGDNSQLSIRTNSPLEVLLTNPDDAATDPLITVSGSFDNVSLSSLSLMDNNSGGGLHIDRVTISNLALVNTSVYFNNADNSIRVDMGNSLNNLRMVLENIVLGGPLDRASRPAGIGDAEIRVTNASLEMTLQPH